MLLCGEPGVGKERLATRIHAFSPRSDVPLVVCHCAALRRNGFRLSCAAIRRERFSEPCRRRKVSLNRPTRGTIFLDAVEALPPAAQESLLRLLKEHTVLRQGGEDPVPVDVRVIAATSAQLDTLVEQGRFSAELYARLNVCALHIPPLRERREDIVPLVEHLLLRNADYHTEKIKRISYPALELLTPVLLAGQRFGAHELSSARGPVLRRRRDPRRRPAALAPDGRKHGHRSRSLPRRRRDAL